jgi:UDP-N-acetylglucosamine acyltransferase
MDRFIHSTSIIEDGALIGDGSYIGPYCHVGQDVVLGERVNLKSHVVISGLTTIGNDSSIFSFASLGQAPQDLKYNGEKSRLEIGAGTTIREYVTANIGTSGGGMLTKIGNGCMVMAYCHVAHDCTIGDGVVIANAVNLSGHVNIGNRVIIGGASAVKQFIRIGEYAMVGGGTLLDHDVIPYGIVMSERKLSMRGINIIGMKRHGFRVDEIDLVLKAYRDIFEENEEIGASFTKNLDTIKERYSHSDSVVRIIDFIQTPSKNPIKT